MTDSIKQVFWASCYYGFLLLFVVGTMIINLLALVAMPLVGKHSARSILRWVSYQLLNFYLVLMETSGALVTNRDILRKIDSASGGLLIISNHPSMVDAPIIFSRIRGLLCVFKSSLSRSLWIGRTTRMIGHLSNDGGLDLIRDLSDALKKGEKVLLFPEGTRTVSDGVDKFNPGYALAALRSKVPVQIIKIHSDTPILSKKQSKLSTTRFPCTFLMEIGPVIQPGRHNKVRTLNREVESWFQAGIGNKVPGTIRFLPCIENRVDSGDASTFTFMVPQDPFYCHGHMPRNPIVPGYIQMIWLRELLQVMRDSPELQLNHLRWKFLKPILPGDTLTMTISFSARSNKVAIRNSGELATQGLFVIAGKGEA